MKLSIIVPGIRVNNWEKLYQSVYNSTTCDWEMIFVGPYEPVKNLGSNTKYIQDWGSPIRCQQIGLIHSDGEYINWAADDGYFTPQSIDIGLSLINDRKTIITGKYFEGDNNEKTMSKDEYYLLNSHESTKSNFISNKYFTLNVGLVPREVLIDIGGWDCRFEACPMSYADLAFRLQNSGYKFIIQNEIMFVCGHMPGTSGDHGPIHYAQVDHDEPLYKSIYSHPSCLERKKIDINNWDKSSIRWSRRFG